MQVMIKSAISNYIALLSFAHSLNWFKILVNRTLLFAAIVIINNLRLVSKTHKEIKYIF